MCFFQIFCAPSLSHSFVYFVLKFLLSKWFISSKIVSERRQNLTLIEKRSSGDEWRCGHSQLCNPLDRTRYLFSVNNERLLAFVFPRLIWLSQPATVNALASLNWPTQQSVPFEPNCRRERTIIASDFYFPVSKQFFFSIILFFVFLFLICFCTHARAIEREWAK